MRDFRFGSHTGFDLTHYETPRESGLPIGHFDREPVWRRVQRWALVAALIVIELALASTRS